MKVTDLTRLSRRRALGLLAILGLKAFGLRSRIVSTASCRTDSLSTLLQQLTQLHPSQYVPDAKHSQYLKKQKIQTSSQGQHVYDVFCAAKLEPTRR